jgi:hypothetical protein
MSQKPLGRRTPEDFTHVEKYPFTAVIDQTVPRVEKALRLPAWHWTHDQGHEGSCEGHGNSMMMSILNGKRYNPWWLWNEGKLADEWPDTNPGDDNGTSGRACCSVLKDQGHCLWQTDYPLRAEGISAYRWATTVDQMRTGIANGLPIAIGVNWYQNFDTPTRRANGETWIGDNKVDLGPVRGGHCVCVYGASDKRQAFKVKNSWGRSYPIVYLPYTVMQVLLDQQGEACLVTDR